VLLAVTCRSTRTSERGSKRRSVHEGESSAPVLVVGDELEALVDVVSTGEEDEDVSWRLL